ncbi:MAG: hypothetical protein AB6733_06750 [Clostridiaceae bacterium]
MSKNFSKDEEELRLLHVEKNINEASYETKTLKKSKRKLKIRGFITIAIVIIVAIVIGYKIGEKPKNDLLTQKDIKTTLEKHGVSLKEDKSQSPDDFEIGEVKPIVYTVGEEKCTMFVYIFKSFVEREELVNIPGKFDKEFMIEAAINAKNALIVYKLPEQYNSEEEVSKIIATKVLISDIVFKYLNEGKEIVYKGEGENWEGTFTLKYYEHWWTDESGKTNYDSNKYEYQEIKYIKSDITNVGPIEFEHKTSVDSGNISGVELDNDGYLHCGGGSGNGALPRKESEITYTIKWNGKEETFKLKAE